MRNIFKVGIGAALLAGGAWAISRFHHGPSGTVPVTPHGSTVTPSGQVVTPPPANPQPSPNAVSVAGHPDVNVTTSDVSAGTTDEPAAYNATTTSNDVSNDETTAVANEAPAPADDTTTSGDTATDILSGVIDSVFG